MMKVCPITKFDLNPSMCRACRTLRSCQADRNHYKYHFFGFGGSQNGFAEIELHLFIHYTIFVR